MLNKLSKDSILFIVDNKRRLKGSLTDGDIRRALIKETDLNNKLDKFYNKSPKFINQRTDLNEIIELRNSDYSIIPILDSDNKVIDILNFRLMKSFLPIDAVIMAGGRGERLKPLTNKIPKPLLKIGDIPIMEHNVNRIMKFGIKNFWFSIRYLGDKIENYFKDGNSKNINIEYVKEDKPLGTIGSLSNIKNFKNSIVLLSNSDILTNLNYENFYLDFLSNDADLSIATVPYDVKIPYAVIKTENNQIISLDEKPTYTYFSNGGIYLMKKSILKYIPKNKFFNATDLIELLMKKNKKVISYPIIDYWLDIGKKSDFQKAQRDISKIKFN
tara:strand:- start:1634 stop:2620 length:987 start_codon:yes stop_codon:yes gene_type:complete